VVNKVESAHIRTAGAVEFGFGNVGLVLKKGGGQIGIAGLQPEADVR